MSRPVLNSSSSLKALIFIISLMVLGSPYKVEAQMSCRALFPSHRPASENSLMEVTWQIHKELTDLKVFGFTKRGRRKELEHMAKDLKGVERHMDHFLSKHPEAQQTLDLWLEFNNYWLGKIAEFQQLPPKQQKKLKPILEIPLSISTKHLISFLETKSFHHFKWGRLQHLLEAHKKSPEADIETVLFLIERASRRYKSRWDFTRCRY